MKKLPLLRLQLYVGLSIVIYLVMQLMVYLDCSLPAVITSYLNDFLVIPIVATAALYVVWMIKKDVSLRLNKWSIVSLVVFYSVYFELYLPEIHDRYTADLIDVLCYALGGIIFYLLQRKS